MNEIVVNILDKFLEHGIEVNEQLAYQILEMVLSEYNIVAKSTELALTYDLPKHAQNFLGCKKYMEGLKEGTLKNYKATLKELCLFVGKSANDIGINDLRNFIFTKYQHLAPTTMCTKIWNLKSFFGWMHIEGIITKNEAVKLVTPKVPKKLRDSQTTEQIELCRQASMDDRERALYEFFISTGCRVSEAVKVKVKDALKQDFVVCGKGSKERRVFINEKALVYIKKYINHRGVDSEYLFISKYKPYQPIKERAMQRVISQLGINASLHLYPHKCRHTMATHMLKNGAALKKVQDALGHESSSTTEVYITSDSESVKIAHQQHAIV